jgi:hypothetical protein
MGDCVNWARSTALLCLLIGLLVLVPHAAFSIGEPSGTATISHGPAASSGTVTWDAPTKTVTITTVTGTLPSGQCVTTWWDWYTNGGGHYDARAIRVCRSNEVLERTWSGERDRVTGLQKLGVCYGPNNRTGDCRTDPRSAPITVRASFCNFTTGSYTLRSNGSVQSCDGGDPTRSSS